MNRIMLIGLVVVATGAALAATFFLPVMRDAPPTRVPMPRTPFGWVAHLAPTAGDGVAGALDGAALQSRFGEPYGLAAGPGGELYVADAGDNNRIRRIGGDGRMATLAGGVEGFADGAGPAARFHTPSGLAVDVQGNLYLADTGNHAIRRVTPQGVVTTLAGTGTAGFRDGPAAQAQFNGPIGVAVDAAGQVFVADTYNDRIRVIRRDGTVTTLAGGERPGYLDGPGAQARFDTPTGVAVDRHGRVWVADTRNDVVRRITHAGVVSTVGMRDEADPARPALRRPLSVALTHDGMLYVGEMAHGRVLQVAPDGRWAVIAGADPAQRLSRPSALALDKQRRLHVADAASFRVHRVEPGVARVPAVVGPAPGHPLPATSGRWPLHPQDGWHEVVGTLGEVRGNYQRENLDHLHGGLDIRGDVGQEVLAIADAKVSSPSGSWGYGDLGEGIALGEISYIHMRVGRQANGTVIDPARFLLLHDETGAPERVRVRRGTRFRTGEVLGTLNPMAHVHLSVGAAGFERNAMELGFHDFADTHPPRIDGIGLFDAAARPLQERADDRIRVPRDLSGVQVVVDAWDQVDRNLPRRRLGLYALGYQWLDGTGVPLPGFEAPRMNIEFNRMPAHPDAVKVAYAPGSGVTVHGSAITRFQYVVTNRVRDGQVAIGDTAPTALLPGDYVLRITARDYSGNLADAKRDLPVRVE